jgi:hypothetical protein
MASKFSGSNFLELATEFDTWRFFLAPTFFGTRAAPDSGNKIKCKFSIIYENNIVCVKDFTVVLRKLYLWCNG